MFSAHRNNTCIPGCYLIVSTALSLWFKLWLVIHSQVIYFSSFTFVCMATSAQTVYKLCIGYHIQNLWFRSESNMFMLKIQTLSVLKGIAKTELTFELRTHTKLFLIITLLCKFHTIVQDLWNKKIYFVPTEFTQLIHLLHTHILIKS